MNFPFSDWHFAAASPNLLTPGIDIRIMSWTTGFLVCHKAGAGLQWTLVQFRVKLRFLPIILQFLPHCVHTVALALEETLP